MMSRCGKLRQNANFRLHVSIWALPLNDQKGQFLGRRIRLIGGEFIGTARVCSRLSQITRCSAIFKTPSLQSVNCMILERDFRKDLTSWAAKSSRSTIFLNVLPFRAASFARARICSECFLASASLGTRSIAISKSPIVADPVRKLPNRTPFRTRNKNLR